MLGTFEDMICHPKVSMRNLSEIRHKFEGDS